MGRGARSCGNFGGSVGAKAPKKDGALGYGFVRVKRAALRKKEKERPPAGSPYRTSQRYEMGEEGRQDANADSLLPRFLVFVSCNPGNSARVAIEDAALKGRRYDDLRGISDGGGGEIENGRLRKAGPTTSAS